MIGVTLRTTLVLGTGIFLAGCQWHNSPDSETEAMVTVLSSETHCEAQEPGLELLEDADAAGVEQISGKGAALRVNLGQKPTPGYSAELEEVRHSEGSLTLKMKATQPAPDAMVAQVITTPCVVLEVPSSGWSRLEVRMDAEGFPLMLEHPNPG